MSDDNCSDSALLSICRFQIPYIWWAFFMEGCLNTFPWEASMLLLPRLLWLWMSFYSPSLYSTFKLFGINPFFYTHEHIDLRVRGDLPLLESFIYYVNSYDISSLFSKPTNGRNYLNLDTSHFWSCSFRRSKTFSQISSCHS